MCFLCLFPRTYLIYSHPTQYRIITSKLWLPFKVLPANGFDSLFGWYLHMRATSSVTSLPAPQISLADHNCQGGQCGYNTCHDNIWEPYLPDGIFPKTEAFFPKTETCFFFPKRKPFSLIFHKRLGKGLPFWEKCAQVFRSCWWMRLFQSSSPKRHVAYSSSPWVERFNLGRLTGWSPKMNKEKNTASYVDPITGKRKWHGTKNLKKTESFPQTILIPIYIQTTNPHFHFPIKHPPDEVLSSSLRDEGCPDLSIPVGRLWGYTRMPWRDRW